ncbi:hypothetical protein BG261_03050 [Floricoccus tropicus]|uniref:Uncharacterized protein n=1 Tax=Floricoccus tropicus TaxID=1859473 RepID=A0A1E8GPP3_9LACT|nr:hypothetical protein [Floricoccus tropicus]OFI49573.1 hypothetical protein BG261_03050 [Floricoccus tropicus]
MDKKVEKHVLGIMVGVWIGIFVGRNILEKMPIDIWWSRIGGLLVALFGAFLYFKYDESIKSKVGIGTFGILISVGIGTFVSRNILEKMPINIWWSRIGGLLVTLLLVFSYIRIENDSNK